MYKLISAAPPPTLSLYNCGNRYSDGHPRLVGGAYQAGQRRKEREANIKSPKMIGYIFVINRSTYKCFY